jgi:hypothetical protein
VRNQVTTLPVHLDPQQQDYTAALDAAAEAAKLAGHPVAALMFTHPANPQGTLFSRQQLGSMIQWCLRNKVHCIRCVLSALHLYVWWCLAIQWCLRNKVHCIRWVEGALYWHACGCYQCSGACACATRCTASGGLRVLCRAQCSLACAARCTASGASGVLCIGMFGGVYQYSRPAGTTRCTASPGEQVG